MVRFIIIMLVCFMCACNDDNRYAVIVNKKDSTENLAVVWSDDQRINEAVTKAKSSFPRFLQVLQGGCSVCERYSVKMRFGYGDGNGEHLWLDSLHFDKGQLKGRIAGQPANIPHLQWGDIIKVDSDSVSDWMYIQDGKLIGGFTTRVLFDDLSAEEKKELEKELGASIQKD